MHWCAIRLLSTHSHGASMGLCIRPFTRNVQGSSNLPAQIPCCFAQPGLELPHVPQDISRHDASALHSLTQEIARSHLIMSNEGGCSRKELAWFSAGLSCPAIADMLWTQSYCCTLSHWYFGSASRSHLGCVCVAVDRYQVQGGRTVPLPESPYDSAIDGTEGVWWPPGGRLQDLLTNDDYPTTPEGLQASLHGTRQTDPCQTNLLFNPFFLTGSTHKRTGSIFVSGVGKSMIKSMCNLSTSHICSGFKEAACEQAIILRQRCQQI